MSEFPPPRPPVTVPLLVSPPRLLRASAIWVEVANWADALADRFGESEIVAGDQRLSSDEVRETLTAREGSGSSRPARWRVSKPAILAETLVKDLRWFWHGQVKANAAPDPDRFEGAPFVWQHHELFQNRGRKLADRLGVPLVRFVDAPFVWESRRWGIRRPGWEWFTRTGDSGPIRSADLVTVVSEDVAEAVADLGVPESGILVTPCTADIRHFDRSRRSETRRELGLEGAFVIGWIGSFRPFHALDLLVDAFAAAAAEVPDARLLLVGAGRMTGPVRERIDRAGLGDRLVMTGAVPHSEVGPLIAAFDLAVLQARSGEDFHYSPLKLREYFAAGVPVIAADVGEVGEVVRESGAGWLVPPGDIGALSAAIHRAAADREALEARSRQAMNFAEENLSTAVQVDRIVDALASLSR